VIAARTVDTNAAVTSASPRQLSAFTLFLVTVSVLMSVSAQLCLRQGMGSLGDHSGLELFGAAARSGWVLAGVSLYGLSTVSWLRILRPIRLVVAYPLGSMSYIFVTLLSAWWLHETVSPLRWTGVLCILLGILVVARGEREAGREPLL